MELNLLDCWEVRETQHNGGKRGEVWSMNYREASEVGVAILRWEKIVAVIYLYTIFFFEG